MNPGLLHRPVLRNVVTHSAQNPEELDLPRKRITSPSNPAPYTRDASKWLPWTDVHSGKDGRLVVAASPLRFERRSATTRASAHPSRGYATLAMVPGECL